MNEIVTLQPKISAGTRFAGGQLERAPDQRGRIAPLGISHEPTQYQQRSEIMLSQFNNRVAVITGAGSGIGRELACQLASAGCHLALSDINMNGLSETVELLPNRGSLKVTSHCLDVADREAVTDYAGQVIADHQKVDLLFNNAGIAGRSLDMADYDYSDYEHVLDVNLWGVIHCTHAFLPHLLDNPGSHLVNVSSVFGLVAPPKTGSYVINKFAVRGYTEALRTELQSNNIHVSCVHPGMIATNIVAAADAPDAVVEKFARSGLSADKAARIILKGVVKKKARILVSSGTYFVDWLQRLFPSGYRVVMMPLLGQLKDTQEHLEKALTRLLGGFVTICATCKKVKNKRERWTPIEQYIEQRMDIQFSHGLCPTCHDEALLELDE